MVNPELGEHESKLWHFIAQYKTKNDGRSPSFDECGKAVGIRSKDHVSRDLQKLEDAGYIHIISGLARGIKLLRHPSPAKSDTIALPLLGFIHAGAPHPTLEQNCAPIDSVQVARNLVGDGENMYVLQVSGDSMIDALVNNGDYVVMEHTRTAENGDMVAVWLKKKHATTLKRLYRRDGWIVLRPENPTLREKKYRPSDIEIQGKVVCIIRTNSKNGINGLFDRPIQTR